MAVSLARKFLRSCGNVYFSNFSQNQKNETARDLPARLKSATKELLFAFVFNKISNRENLQEWTSYTFESADISTNQ